MRILDRSVYGLWYSGDCSGLLISCYWIHQKSICSQLSILISLYFFFIDYVFGCLQIDLSTKWNVFSITEIHKRQFHSFICILHHYPWLYHDIQIIRKMGIILLLWSIHICIWLKAWILILSKQQQIFSHILKPKCNYI